MINREVYEKDPASNKLLNNGVAKVTSGPSDPELETLRYELTNFVCDGQYATGLARILSVYLTNLDKSEQPGVWVSGFYGSGKSHLVKMLQHLWSDFQFPDGARARGLAKLPQPIQDLLTELSTQARRLGGLHAAAGTLGAGAGDSVRLELLGIIFKSVGLPEHYASANFVMWLRREELEDVVRAHLTAAGRDFDLEVENLYVSDAMARAILAARPEFANTPAEVKILLEKQFPDRTDVSLEEMIAKIKQALSNNNKLPCTLIVLDEVQQYIGESLDRSKAVQDLQEHCCARLGANVIIVATGQNALAGTPLLQRLQGRFPVDIELQDTDVEQVTREVVLKKKSSVVPTLTTELDAHSGEIERHLVSTKIAPTTRDRSVLVQDYPLLPVRRRFWERVLRAVDKAGTGAQLRTQLWIVYDAVQQTADLPLGHVVSAAFLFEHIKSRVLQSGVLLQEISETIARQQQEVDGDLRYRLCALIFLIGQLPHQGPADTGIRANAEILADLLVTDLTSSSAELRKKVLDLLDKLVASGAVMQVEDEYRMQTREGSEWNQAYQEVLNRILNDPGKIGSERAQLLQTQCSDILKKVKLLHGASKEARRFDLHFGGEPPSPGGTAVPLWIRDGWEVEGKTVVDEARATGDTAAAVYGFIPRKHAEELRRVIASCYAATTTLDTKGTPSTPEGIEARKAMETRQEQAQRTRDNLITELLHETTIYIAGGDQTPGLLLGAKVQEAAGACLDRLFPQFHQADSPDWHKVIERARRGAGDPLTVVGHTGDPEGHPVCNALLNYVGSGKKGTEIRRHFGGSRYGWPQDAMDAALIVLCNAGLLQARSGPAQVAKGKLDQKNIASTDFRVETVTLSTIQLIQIRTLFKTVGLTAVQPGQESANVPEFLNRMRARAEAAGGAPPLPQRSDVSHLTDLGNRVGNDQLRAIHEVRDRLSQEATDWQQRQELIAQREPRWRQLQDLLMHATVLPVANEVQPEVEAIAQHRRLLDDPDPAPGLVDKVTHALRVALNHASAQCQRLHQDGRQTLTDAAVWHKLTPEQQEALTRQYHLDDLPTIAVGSPEEILGSLRATRLQEWQNLCDAVPTRFNQVLTAAAQLLEPKAQHMKLPGGTIKNDEDLQAWLTTAEQCIRTRLKDGPVIL
jgi:hypothetical protein